MIVEWSVEFRLENLHFAQQGWHEDRRMAAMDSVLDEDGGFSSHCCFPWYFGVSGEMN